MLPVFQESKDLLNFTKPFISFPVVISTRNDAQLTRSLWDVVGDKVAVVEGSVTA